MDRTLMKSSQWKVELSVHHDGHLILSFEVNDSAAIVDIDETHSEWDALINMLSDEVPQIFDKARKLSQ